MIPAKRRQIRNLLGRFRAAASVESVQILDSRNPVNMST